MAVHGEVANVCDWSSTFPLAPYTSIPVEVTQGTPEASQ
jgi:hypothetical protein